MSLVLGGEINTPVEFVLKFYFALLDLFLKDLNTLSICDSSEWCVNNFLKSLNEALFNELVEEFELF